MWFPLSGFKAPSTSAAGGHAFPSEAPQEKEEEEDEEQEEEEEEEEEDREAES